jgi:uncharacterized metal-binding protein
MPSGRTHDAITILLTVPAFAAGYAFTNSLASSAVVGSAFLFGGLMFGPDLDTVSRQYSRWSILRFIWIPYRRFFRHRSRFSHGLIFGALLRVIYFMGVVSLAALCVSWAYAALSGGKVPGIAELIAVWQQIGVSINTHLADNFLLLVFAGLWLGAASHTFTDMAGSFVRTGRVADLL